MGQMLKDLRRIQDLWQQSGTYKRLSDLVLEKSEKTAQIKKIVYLGLGRRNREPSFYASAQQHLTVFSLVNTLDVEH